MFSFHTITGRMRGGSKLNRELYRVRCLIAGQLSADGWSVPMIAQLFPGRSLNLVASWVRKARQMRRDEECKGLGLTPYRRDPRAKAVRQ